MPNFKDSQNKIHWLDEGVDPATIPNFPQDAVEISDEEANPLPTQSQILQAQVAELKAQLDSMERQAIMPRGAREAFIALCKQQGTAAGLNETQLYAVNPFYQGLKDTDTAATAIRAQIRALT